MGAITGPAGTPDERAGKIRDPQGVVVPVSRYDHVVDVIGSEIVHGHRQPGETFTTSDVEASLGVSRSVAREALRLLQSLGLLRASTKVGSTVQDASHWNTLAPQIIQWRMSGPESGAQLRALTELRVGIEPAAAALAARRATWQQSQLMSTCARRMTELGAAGRGDSSEFLKEDVVFHTTLLEATANPAFSALIPTLAACLESRNAAGLTPQYPSADNLARHENIAQAIIDRDEQGAKSLTSALLATVTGEVGSGESGEPEHDLG